MNTEKLISDTLEVNGKKYSEKSRKYKERNCVSICRCQDFFALTTAFLSAPPPLPSQATTPLTSLSRQNHHVLPIPPLPRSKSPLPRTRSIVIHHFPPKPAFSITTITLLPYHPFPAKSRVVPPVLLPKQNFFPFQDYLCLSSS